MKGEEEKKIDKKRENVFNGIKIRREREREKTLQREVNTDLKFSLLSSECYAMLLQTATNNDTLRSKLNICDGLASIMNYKDNQDLMMFLNGMYALRTHGNPVGNSNSAKNHRLATESIHPRCGVFSQRHA